MLPALVLCGGRGTRAYPLTAELPKPLLSVGDQPVLRHVLDIYARQGVREFVLAGGFRCDLLADYAAGLPADWRVDVVDTGEGTGTGGRVVKCREHLGDRFFATYGDGVGNVDLSALVAAHDAAGAAATLTTVPLRSQFGTVDIGDDGRVTAFREKPVLDGHWINAGFFVVDDRAFDAWAGDDLEQEVLPALAARGELAAYRHRGFWRSVDTQKDLADLTALATTGSPPWQS
jgi:glucose-1-phosphate cytidylyltransferase